MSDIGPNQSIQIEFVCKLYFGRIQHVGRNKLFERVCTYSTDCELKCDEKVIRNYLRWSLTLDYKSDGLFYFTLYSTSIIALMKCCPLSGYVTIGTNFSDLEQTFPIQISVHSIRKDGYCGDFSISLDPEIRERKLRVWQDNILFVVELSTPGNDLDTIASSIENDEYSLSSDLERIRIDEDFSDVTISVKGKNYPAHKLILAARSSVFKAMFKNNMQESQTNHITITDMEQETFEEMLRYIYTGKMPNLEEWAFELLPAADKYDLKELKNACERLLLTEISAENVGKVLVLADMHNADELKAHALLFIKENSADFEPEIWNVLTESRPGLMKDILAILLKK